jgi:protein-tyrosine phosphatase
VLRICFVCLGNICRSPTAEAVMAALLARHELVGQIELDSAGTGRWHIGELADPRTRAAAARRGLSLTHRARQLTRADGDRFDLLVGMDASNLRAARAIVGDHARAELVLLRAFDAEAPAGAEVPDPYSGGPAGFEQVLDQCERACAGLLRDALRRLRER